MAYKVLPDLRNDKWLMKSTSTKYIVSVDWLYNLLFLATQNHFIATASTQFSPFQKPYFSFKNPETFAQQWELKSFYSFEVIYL